MAKELNSGLATMKQLLLVVRAGLELGTFGFQVRRPNHPPIYVLKRRVKNTLQKSCRTDGSSINFFMFFIYIFF